MELNDFWHAGGAWMYDRTCAAISASDVAAREAAHQPRVVRVRVPEGETSFDTVDFVGEKTFNDTTLPRGVDGVSYIITGKAGQQTGPASAMFTLTFGSVGGGGTTFITSSVETPADVKLAA